MLLLRGVKESALAARRRVVMGRWSACRPKQVIDHHLHSVSLRPQAVGEKVASKVAIQPKASSKLTAPSGATLFIRHWPDLTGTYSDEMEPHGVSSSNPRGITVSQGSSELVIVRQWFDRDYTVPATSRAVLFNVFLVFFFYTSSSTLFLDPITGGISPAIVIAFILLATGILLAYSVATDWLNRTVIVINRTVISVRHGPLPWPGNKVVSVAGIKQLHAVMSEWSRSVRRRRLYTFDLVAETADGQRTKIAGGFKKPEAAKHAIERYLAIEPVQSAPPDAAELDRQAINKFLSGQPFEQSLAVAAVRKGNGPRTNLTAVIAFWIFILLWNGFVWWYVRLTVSTEGTISLWQDIAPISPLVLIGLGLIYWAIRGTIKYFRERGTAKPVEKWGKKEWMFLGVMVWFGFIALTFFWMVP